MAERRHHARLVEEPIERALLIGAREVWVEQLDRDIAIELGIASEIHHAGRTAAELAHQAITCAGLDADHIAGCDGLARDRRGAAGELAQALDADAHVGIIDVATKDRLVVAQRALVIFAPARVLGEQIVRTQRVLVDRDQELEVGERGLELAALLVALDENRAHCGGLALGHLGHAEQLLGPFDREPLVPGLPQTFELREDIVAAGLVASLAIAEILDELREEHFLFAAERLRLARGVGGWLRQRDGRGAAAEQSAKPRALGHGRSLAHAVSCARGTRLLRRRYFPFTKRDRNAMWR